MNSATPPEVLTTPETMRAWGLARRTSGQRIALVPTMGALHAGHLSLMRHAASLADAVVVSIFVNPTQFGPNEDFSRYPRHPQADVQACQTAGVHAVFMPEADALYPTGHSVFVDEQTRSQVLCGQSRPGHFRGVLTVVAILFNIVQPNVAVFGQKDAQQTALIRQMVRDLHLPLTVAVAPTLRESDGLAMSSRNRYLSPAQRLQARALHAALQCVADDFKDGRRNAAQALERARQRLQVEPELHIEYLACVSAESLKPVARLVPGVLVAVAARLGNCRLIDNLVLPQEPSAW